MSAEEKKAVIKEFNLRKGVLVATFSGVMSACFSYGLRAGDPIKQIALRHGTSTLWQGLPVLVPVLLGGFTTNFIWCLILNIRNRSGHEYLDSGSKDLRVPLAANYTFSALAGTIWYFQFFFYTMGETQMGAYKFSSWTLHMASIIIFSSLWGIALHEWRSKRPHEDVAVRQHRRAGAFDHGGGVRQLSRHAGGVNRSVAQERVSGRLNIASNLFNSLRNRLARRTSITTYTKTTIHAAVNP